MAEEVQPKQCIVTAHQKITEVREFMMKLDEAHIKLKDVEFMQKKLSQAAQEMTKLRAYMIENQPVKPEPDHDY